MMAGAFACGIGLMCVVPFCIKSLRELLKYPRSR